MKIKKAFFILVYVFLIVSIVVSAGRFVRFFAVRPKVSIIMPVYKTEKYLEESLKSAEDQTLKNIEIICVNDGSPDDCANIIMRHKRNDVRVRFVNKLNGGVSSARNVGIKKARGEYILFFDSDDLISPDLCKTVYDKAKEKDFDIVEFGLSEFIDGEKIDFEKLKCEEAQSCEETQRQENENPFDKLGLSVDTVCGKLWKRSIIVENDVSFSTKIKSNEDVLFNYLSFPFAKSAAIIRNGLAIYAYRRNRLGAVTSVKDPLRDTETKFILCEEILNSAHRFNFDYKFEWALGVSLKFMSDGVSKYLEDESDKSKFATRGYNYIDKYINEHGLELSDSQQENLNILRKYADT